MQLRGKPYQYEIVDSEHVHPPTPRGSYAPHIAEFGGQTVGAGRDSDLKGSFWAQGLGVKRPPTR